jgi:hypothetical protein
MEDASARYRVVPVVSPISNDPNTSGRVRNLHTGGGVVHKQIVPSPNSPSGWEVHPSYGRAGWVLLHDCYLREEDEAGWNRYKKYLDHWAKGLTSSSFPEGWLPKEVQRRRKANAVDEFAAAGDDFRVKPTTGETTPSTRAKPAKGGES